MILCRVEDKLKSFTKVSHTFHTTLKYILGIYPIYDIYRRSWQRKGLLRSTISSGSIQALESTVDGYVALPILLQ